MIDNLLALLKNTKERGTVPLWLQLYDQNREYLHVEALCQLEQLELNNEQYDTLMEFKQQGVLDFTIEGKL